MGERVGDVEKGLVTEWDPKKDLRIIRFLYVYLSGNVFRLNFFSIVGHIFNEKNTLPSIEVMVVSLKEFEFYFWQHPKQILRLLSYVKFLNDDVMFLKPKKIDGEAATFPKLNKANDLNLKNLFRKVFYMSCLADSDFEWIDVTDDRQCYFVWGWIRLIREKPRSNKNGLLAKINSLDPYRRDFEAFSFFEFDRGGKDEQVGEKYLFEQYCDDFNTSGNQKKINKVIGFFDLMRGELENRRALNNLLKAEWSKRVNDLSLVSWLKKNEELSVWAYNYILKTHFHGTPPNWMKVHGSSDAQYSLSCRMAVVAFYDLLPSEKYQQQFLGKIKTSGRQQKAREKLKKTKGGKGENFINISKDVHDKLKVIAQIHGRKKEDVIERLINHVYGKLREKSIIG